jgi:hypothetical protein
MSAKNAAHKSPLIAQDEFQPVDPSDTTNALLGLEEGLSLLASIDQENVRWRASFQIAASLIVAGLTRKD